MMDAVLPGGIARDLAADGLGHVTALLQDIRRSFPELIELYDNTASLQDRTASTGIDAPSWHGSLALAATSGVPAAAPSTRARSQGIGRTISSPSTFPSSRAATSTPASGSESREIEQSLGLVEQILNTLPSGAVRTELGLTAGIHEGLGMAEAFRGDVLAWSASRC